MAGLVRDVSRHEGKRGKLSEYKSTLMRGDFAIAGIPVSSVVLTHLHWHPESESTASHELVGGGYCR